MTFSLLFSIFFATVLAIATVSTLIDLYFTKPSKHFPSVSTSIFNKQKSNSRLLDELLVSFSLWKNAKALFNLDRNPSDVSTIHGIRFINAALLLISHKSMANFYNPYTNRTQMIEVSVSLFSSFRIQCRLFHFYTKK